MASKASYRPVVKRSSSELIDVLDSSETSAAGKCCDFAFESWISNDLDGGGAGSDKMMVQSRLVLHLFRVHK